MRKAIAILLIAILMAPFISIDSNALTLSDVEQAINLGTQAIYDAIRPIEVNGEYYYIMPDHPSPTISVEYNGQLYVPGSFLDPGDLSYRSELVYVSNNQVAWRYYYNVDNDDDYDIIVYASLSNVDYNTDKLYIYLEKAEYTITLVVGSALVYRYNNVGQGWSTTIYIDESNDYRFHSARYVLRHSTIIAAWLLEDEGYTYFANKMETLWDNIVDFDYDVYAPVFGRSNSYPDNFFDLDYATWISWNGYSGHPWNTDPSSDFINYPYKSRMYIFNELGITDMGIRGWEDAPLYLLLKALHLLNKYGASKQAEVEQLIAKAIDEGSWDGYGLKSALLDPTWVTSGYRTAETVPYSYKGYPVYLNAVFLATLVKYYEVTGDRWISGNDILYIADRLAGILVKLQWNYIHETPWGTVKLALFRGWWPAAYDIGSLISKPSAWGILDTITSGLDAVAEGMAKIGIDVSNGLLPMPSEWPFAVVNSESTILAVQALKLYYNLAQQLGRSPVDPLSDPTIGANGRFVEEGGGGSGTIHGGDTDDGGRWIYAMAITPGLGGDAWHYQYAKYELELSQSGDYSLVSYLLIRYNTYDSLGSSAKGILVFKVIDSSGTVLSQLEVEAFNIDEDSSAGGAVAKSVELQLGYLPAGTYYIEVGIKAIADNGPVSFNGAVVHAYAYPDYVALEPS